MIFVYLKIWKNSNCKMVYLVLIDLSKKQKQKTITKLTSRHLNGLNLFSYIRNAYFSSLLFVLIGLSKQAYKIVIFRQAECQLFWQICFLSIWNDNPFPKKNDSLIVGWNKRHSVFDSNLIERFLSNFNPVWSLCHESEHILFPTYGQLYYLLLCA